MPNFTSKELNDILSQEGVPLSRLFPEELITFVDFTTAVTLLGEVVRPDFNDGEKLLRVLRQIYLGLGDEASANNVTQGEGDDEYYIPELFIRVGRYDVIDLHAAKAWKN